MICAHKSASSELLCTTALLPPSALFQEPPLPLPGFTTHTTSVRHICHWCWHHQTLRPQLLGTAASTAILCILCLLHMLRASTPALPAPCSSWSPQVTHSTKLCGKGRVPLSILMLNSFIFKQLTERKSPMNGGFMQSIYHITRQAVWK